MPISCIDNFGMYVWCMGRCEGGLILSMNYTPKNGHTNLPDLPQASENFWRRNSKIGSNTSLEKYFKNIVQVHICSAMQQVRLIKFLKGRCDFTSKSVCFMFGRVTPSQACRSQRN